MSKPKIVIEIRGGVLVAVHATQPIEYVLVDYDNIHQGQAPVCEPSCEDRVFGDGYAHTLFTDANDPHEMEVRDELKTIKF